MSGHQGKEVLEDFDRQITTKILYVADVKLMDPLGRGMTPRMAANHFRVKQKRQAPMHMIPTSHPSTRTELYLLQGHILGNISAEAQ